MNDENKIFNHFTDISAKARKYIEGLDSDEVTDVEDFDNFNDLVMACIEYRAFILQKIIGDTNIYDKFTDIDK
jgi:hypothetical protein